MNGRWSGKEGDLVITYNPPSRLTTYNWGNSRVHRTRNARLHPRRPRDHLPGASRL